VPASVYLYGLLGSFFDGLQIGAIYGLMGLGLTLIFRVTKIANFAYAEYVTYAGYAAALVAAALGGPAAVVATLLAAVAVAAAVDELAFKPLWHRGATSLTLLVASMAVGFVLRYSLLTVAAARNLLELRVELPRAVLFTVGGIANFTTVHLAALAAAALITGGLHWMFTRTKMGKAMRATASNPTLARITGIDIYAVRRLTWLLAGGIAGIAGLVYAYHTYINPESGWLMLLWMFAAAIMGGFTFLGTLLSGFILGLTEAFVGYILSITLGVGTEYNIVIALVALAFVMLFRPEGLIRLESYALRRRA